MEERTNIREVQFPNAVLLPEVVRMLDEGHSVTLRLRGFSMRPFLENNRDKALLKKAGEVKVGDAVLAEIEKGKYVLHRIVKIEGDDITLLGDGNLRTEHCKTGDIRASVEGSQRKRETRPHRRKEMESLLIHLDEAKTSTTLSASFLSPNLDSTLRSDLT